MKIRLLSSVSAIALASSFSQLHAADLDSAPSAAWNGWYFGGYIGANQMTGELAASSDDSDFSSSGVAAGLQLGYNWQNGDTIWGIEGDVGFMEPAVSFLGHQMSADTSGSLRVRVGRDLGNSTFAYITAGAGLLHGNTNSSSGDNNNSFTVFRPVAGFGVEAALNERFSVKAEALGYFGSNSPSGPSDENTLGNVYVARIGVNMHLGETGYNQASEAQSSGGGWNGFYFGGHLGAGLVEGEIAISSDDYNFIDGGALAGLQLGYNYQTESGGVWGIEGDVTFSDAGIHQYGHPVTPDTMASLRVRYGRDIGNGVLGYVTAGAGLLTGLNGSSDSDRFRYTTVRPVVGFGFETALTSNISLRAEGLGYFGSDTLRHRDVEEDSTLDNVYVARIGLNMHLGSNGFGDENDNADVDNSSWNGFYAGGFIGAANASGENAVSSDDRQFVESGAIAGLQLGYNFDMDTYIWGIEADVGFADPGLRAAGHFIGPDVMGSLRGRVGKDIGGGTFAYITAGAGVIHGVSQSSDGGDSNKSYTVYRPVAGFGIEAPISNRISLKAEGLGYFGSNSPSGPSDENVLDNVYVARIGLNMHLGGNGYGRIPAGGADAWEWQGAYAGGHVGASRTSGELASTSDDYTFTSGGALAGLQLGYNFVNDNFIWGVEADASFSDARGQNKQHHISPSFIGSVRGRIGTELMGKSFAYITGGAGVLHGVTGSSDGDNNKRFTVWRPVAGFGVETPLTSTMSLKAEGLGYFGSNSPNGPSEENVLEDVFVARIGLNFKF